MNRWLGSAIALIAISALAPAEAQTAIKPAIVYSTGGKFDKSFNEGVSDGAQKFNKETGIAIAEFEPSNETQFEQAHRRFAQRGQDPIVAVGFSQAVALEKVAKEFPNSSFFAGKLIFQRTDTPDQIVRVLLDRGQICRVLG
jgi:basic membrane protein A